MGDWRTVTITGSIDPGDVDAARFFVEIGDDWDRFHPLCFSGASVFGLNRWIPAEGGPISVVGNLSERNYSVDDVAETLRQLHTVAPSLVLKVHCGGSYEDERCIATVTVGNGQVVVGDPEVNVVGVGLADLGMARLRKMIGGD